MSLFKFLKPIIEDTNSLAGRVFDITVQGLVLISLASFSIETLPDISPNLRYLLHIVEIVIVILFTIEYLLRIGVADKKLSFVFSIFGIVDLVAILPFYLSTGVDLRSIRVIRLLRIFRILKLARFGKATERFRLAFQAVREELILFISASAVLLYISGVGIYFFENKTQPEVFSSVFDGLWWAIISLTSVGYGDVYPVTVGGKIFTSFVLLIGLGVVAVPTGLFASALSKVRVDFNAEESETTETPNSN